MAEVEAAAEAAGIGAQQGPAGVLDDQADEGGGGGFARFEAAFAVARFLAESFSLGAPFPAEAAFRGHASPISRTCASPWRGARSVGSGQNTKR